MTEVKRRFEALLKEDLASCQRREKNAFDVFAKGRSGIVLFGAGGLGRKVLQALRADGVEPLGFIDNKLAGTVVDRVEVYTPAQAAAKWSKSAVFVVTIWASWADTMREQIESLRTLGCEAVTSFIPLLWKYPELLPHVQVDLPSRLLERTDEIRTVFDLWEDEVSRAEFVAQLQWRLFGDFDELGDPVPNQYWQRDLIRLSDDSVFADAGAFDGDTFAQFASFTSGAFRKAFLFEPDRGNLRAIQDRLRAIPEELRRRVQVFECAVADGEYEISFQGGAGPSSMPGSGSAVVPCRSLDNSLPEPPSLIKFDIEGFELRGLQGARRTIALHKPHLAVCVYHTQSHLWEVPLLIHSINPEYRFYLRPHGQIWETVCYAVPSGR